MTVMDNRATASLSPMWQRIARGEVDLSQYDDEAIRTGRLAMADGRTLPPPKVYPDTFIREQVRRGLRTAERKIREGAEAALDVYREIMDDDTLEPKDRLKAGEFFLTRFLGKPDQHLHVHKEDTSAAREMLVERLLAARKGLPAATVAQIANGEEPGEVVDAELVDEATIHLEDLL